MRVIVLLRLLVRMQVLFFFRALVSMQMRVLVCVLMRVRQSVVPVFMRVHVHVRVRVLQYDRIGNREICAEDHDSERHQKLPFQMIPEQDPREDDAQKRRNRVVRTGLRGTEIALRANIKEYAQAVRREAK